MKSNIHSSPYFSAYPLKALNQEPSAKPSNKQSPFLKAILSGKTRTISRIRVLPLANPYKQKTTTPVRIKDSKLPKDIELTEKEWFNNYE